MGRRKGNTEVMGAEREGATPDLSRIDFEDEVVYDRICSGDTVDATCISRLRPSYGVTKFPYTRGWGLGGVVRG